MESLPTNHSQGNLRQNKTWKLTPEQREEIVSLYRSGLSHTELAGRFAVTISTVHSLIKRRGVPLHGRVWKSKAFNPEELKVAFWAKVAKLGDDDCWLWTGARTPAGYGTISRKIDGRQVYMYTHRLSYTFAYGEIPTDLCVLHRCDNPPCVNPAHLFLGTKADNMADMIAKGRQCWLGANHPAKGESHPHAKLTEKTVRAIRADHAAGLTYAELSRKYGIGQKHARYICLRMSWKHLR